MGRGEKERKRVKRIGMLERKGDRRSAEKGRDRSEAVSCFLSLTSPHTVGNVGRGGRRGKEGEQANDLREMARRKESG